MQYLENINKIDYLFLTDIYEPDENELLLQVKGAVVADAETEVYVTAEKTIRANALSIDRNAPCFEIYFENYVAYHVLNESFSGSAPDDQFEKVGFCRFRVFSRSEYMEYILKTTFADHTTTRL